MVLRCLVITAMYISSSLGQYGGEMRADITFDDDNDRFDVSNIIKEQNRVYEEPTEMESEYRRAFSKLLPLFEVLQDSKRRRNKKALRHMMDDFAYHDKMIEEDNNFEEDGAFDRNLATFISNNSRRNRIHVQSDRRDVKSYRRDTGGSEVKKNRKIKSNSAEDAKKKEGIHNAVLNYLHEVKEIERRQNGRRSEDTIPDREVLLNHAVPLTLKVSGFLEVPQEI